MTTLRTAAQAALDALDRTETPYGSQQWVRESDAQDALRAALAQPEPQGEPVGHVHREGRRADGKPWMAAYFKQDGTQDLPEGTPLYTAPPQRQPLTPRELQLIDGMIEVQMHHASQCDGIANRKMAEKQKAWDMERVELLRKLRGIGGAQ